MRRNGLRRGGMRVAGAVVLAVASLFASAAPAIATQAPSTGIPASSAAVPARELGPDDGNNTVAQSTADLCDKNQDYDANLPELFTAGYCYDHPGLRSGAADTKYTFNNTVYRASPRWQGATSGYFTKIDGLNIGAAIGVASRTFSDAPYMSFGNGAWAANSGIVKAATDFDPINAVGGAFDQAGGALVTNLVDTATVDPKTVTAIAFALGLVIIITVVRSRGRGGGLIWRRLVGIVLIMGLLFGMASQFKSQPQSSLGSFNPAPMTPGWVVKELNSTVSKGVEIAADGITNGVGMISSLGGDEAGGSGDLFHCEGYPSVLEQRRKEMTSLQEGRLIPELGGDETRPTVEAMDAMWLITGVETWKRTQLGFNNPYADAAYCHVLDFRSDTATAHAGIHSTRDLADARGGSGFATFSKPHLSAAFAPTSAENQAASMVAWAACQATGVNGDDITWKWRAGWEGWNDKDPMTADNAQESCDDWWDSRSNQDGRQEVPAVFKIHAEPAYIADDAVGAVAPESTSDYVNALTGVNGSSSTAASMSYGFGSVLSLLAFGFVSIVSVLAGFALAAFVFVLWFVVLAAVFSQRPWADRIGKALNQVLGLTIFSSMISLVIALTAMAARVMIITGNERFGSGSIMSMLWSGVAPVVALLSVHLLFKKVFKLPSPVSLGGASAWMKSGASGAIGAGVGAGVGTAMAQRFGRGASSMARGAGSKALSKMTGGRLGSTNPLAMRGGEGRRSAMDASGKTAQMSKSQAQEEKAEHNRLAAEQREGKKQELAAAKQWGIENGVRRLGLRGSAGLEAAKRQDERKSLRQMRHNTSHEMKQAIKAGDTATADRLRAEQDEREQQIQAGRQERLAKMSGAQRVFASLRDAPSAAAARARAGVSHATSAVANSAPANAIKAEVGATGGQIRSMAKAAAESAPARGLARGAQATGRAAALASQVSGITPAAQAIGRGADYVATRRRENRQALTMYRERQHEVQAQQRQTQQAQAAQQAAAQRQAEQAAQAQAMVDALKAAGLGGGVGAGASGPRGNE